MDRAGSEASGRASPLGARRADGGTNFSVWSRTAAQVDLLLFDDVDDARPSRVIALEPLRNRTSNFWHVLVPDVEPGQVYVWRVHGTFDPAAGLRHDASALLLDPYGVAVAVPANYDRMAGTRPGRDPRTAMKSVVGDLSAYDWEGDMPLGRPFARTVIYEVHVRGLTAHHSSGVDRRLAGSYAGLVAKIPYLRSLGVTAVELLPVQAFDPQDGPPGLVNYWGYSPVSFFAPHPAYACASDPLGALDEFRTMVKELHRAGIEVILDVVFNHTAEGGAGGPTFCWRGFDNRAYYLLDRGTRPHTWTTQAAATPSTPTTPWCGA
ncbi:MAG: alpha-amylase family glycosyl hydrolase [Mycobacterium sp.]